MVEVNHCQPIIQITKRIVYLQTTYEQRNQFAIGYMINPSIHINKVTRKQVVKFLRATFHENITEAIRYVIKNKDTCVFVLIMFYESKGKKPKKCKGC